ncbi:MAG: methionine gamma-lyase family protein [bacterium]|nr:methionine gamma-lyase family protein [bacterium]
MNNELFISPKVYELANVCEEELRDKFKEISDVCFKNTKKVLEAFIRNGVSSMDLNGTNGYGFNDIGREKIDKIFSEVLGAEDALVRGQFVSGTHVLTVCLFGILRPGDTLLSITGKPYDTLHEVIGIRENPSSLKAFGINYEEVSLTSSGFDVERIKEVLKNKKVKLIEIQRSKGYSSRKSITISMIEDVIKEIRKVDKDVIIMVDNCYCALVEEKSPLEVGADIIAGSLIKNLGGGSASCGGYIAGRSDLVFLASERLAIPGEGKDIGATNNMNMEILKGLYMAPSVVKSSVMTATLASLMLEKLGFDTEPKYNEERADIVLAIKFNDPDKMIRYCCGIQMASPIDSYVKPIPDEMPGYGDKIVMAAGSFVQGSTIELSCDGPLRPPYIAYQQGALTYEYGKLGVMKAITEITK